MKIIKNTLFVSSYVLLAGVMLCVGCVIGKSSTDTESRAADSIIEDTAEETMSETFKYPVYELILQNGILEINRCIGEDKTLITSEEISEDVFPYEDVQELQKGVIFNRLDAAQQMFENFVS